MPVKAHIFGRTELPSVDTPAHSEPAPALCAKLPSVMETYAKLQACLALLSGGACCSRNEPFIEHTMESTTLQVRLCLLFEAV